MTSFSHNFLFDPCYGYKLDTLLAVSAPDAPDDFVGFWQTKYQKIITIEPYFSISHCGSHSGYKIHDLRYQSTNGFTIGGWLLEPEGHAIKQCIVVGHGYGGREGPDYHLDIPETALLFPCFRGISRSRCNGVSDQPNHHVLHNIEHPQHYIIGGCAEDLWLSVSVLHQIYPQTMGKVGYMGISFGGGIGALALPWDERFQRVHLNIPTFGHQPLRMQLPSIGSADSLQAYAHTHSHALATLAYYDAAVAARFAKQPLHIAAALFDPMVAPPGQFAIHNAWAGAKQLFVLDAGHFDYPQRTEQDQQLLRELRSFFGDMSS